jgi:hypothetical protein
MAVVLSGMGMMFQTGCLVGDTLEFLQTVFLGVTAAGAYAILRNI